MAHVLKFSNKDDEISYWKERSKEFEEKAQEIENEYEEFRESSSTLEKELEKSLEQSEQSFREMRTKCNRLTFDLDNFRVSTVS